MQSIEDVPIPQVRKADTDGDIVPAQLIRMGNKANKANNSNNANNAKKPIMPIKPTKPTKPIKQIKPRTLKKLIMLTKLQLKVIAVQKLTDQNIETSNNWVQEQQEMYTVPEEAQLSECKMVPQGTNVVNI